MLCYKSTLVPFTAWTTELWSLGTEPVHPALNHLLSRNGSAPPRLHVVPAAPFGELSPATCMAEPSPHPLTVTLPSPLLPSWFVTTRVWHSTLRVVPQLMLDPSLLHQPVWSQTISLALWITPKPQTVRTTSITAAMGPVPPAASAAFQRLTRTN